MQYEEHSPGSEHQYRSAAVVTRKLSQVAFVVGLLIIIVFSLLPREYTPEMGGSDKLYHLMAYAALVLVGGIGFKGLRPLLLVALGLLILGVGLELAQAIVPGRYASGHDALANMAGIILGCLAAASANGLARKWRRGTG